MTTTFNTEIEMSRVLQKQLGAVIGGFTAEAVRALAQEYSFDASEAIGKLGLDSVTIKAPAGKKATKTRAAPTAAVPKEKRVLPSIPLPFCGDIDDTWCQGIRLNHGLYTQCTMEQVEGDLCKTCHKQCSKEGNNGQPTYGRITTRSVGEALEFRDPKGKQVSAFGNVMAKLSITREAAVEEAAKFGWTIPEEQFEVRQATRGRPKKDASASDTDEEAPAKKVAKRGRPKKDKKVVAAAVGDDLIASLVAAANDGQDADVSDSDSSDDNEPTLAPQPPVAQESVAQEPVAQEPVAKKAVAKKPVAKKPVAKKEVVIGAGSQKLPAKKGGRKAKVPQHFAVAGMEPHLHEDAWQAMGSDERKQWLKDNKPVLSDEEMSAKKAAALEKRRATLAAKKAAAEEETNQVIAVEPVSQTEAVVALDAIEVAQVLASKGEAPVPAPAVELEEEEVSEDEEEEVVKFEHDGTTYLKAADGVLYDQETQEPVGVWDAETKSIIDMPEDEDED